MTNNYNLIEAYLNGALSEEEVAAFQERLKTEPAFLEAYEMRKSMFLLLKNKKNKADLRSKLNALSNKYVQEEKTPERTGSTAKQVRLKPKWGRYVAAAAVLLLIFVVNNSIPRQNIYKKYAEDVKMDMMQKSTTTFSFEEIQTAFNTGNYEFAYHGLHEYLKTTKDSEVYFHLGVCALELNKTAEATAIFKTFDDDPNFKSDGKYFQVLSYLKAKDFINCKKILGQITEGDKWYAKAQELLKEMEGK